MSVQKMIESRINAAMQQLVQESQAVRNTDLSRTTNLRFSGFPFCGTRWFLNLPISLAEKMRMNFGMRFFTAVGTTVHEAIQEMWGSLKDVRVYNDYLCRSCKHREYLKKKVLQCPSCGSTNLSKEEHELRYKNALGHIDELIWVELPEGMQTKFKLKKGLIVIDYKTTMLAKVTAKKSALPYKENVFQISGYASALHESGLPILGYCLIYVPRDNPFQFKVCAFELTPKNHAEAINRMDYYVENFGAWSSAKTLKRVIKLVEHRPCTPGETVPEDFEGCKWANLCTSLDGEEILMQKINTVFNQIEHKLPIKDLKK